MINPKYMKTSISKKQGINLRWSLSALHLFRWTEPDSPSSLQINRAWESFISSDELSLRALHLLTWTKLESPSSLQMNWAWEPFIFSDELSPRTLHLFQWIKPKNPSSFQMNWTYLNSWSTKKQGPSSPWLLPPPAFKEGHDIVSRSKGEHP